MQDKTHCYIKILQEELVLATGCTEPISLAYAASIAKKYLTSEAKHMICYCSKNIVKNVKCVTVPNTNGLVGIEASAITGLVAGVSEKKMEVIDFVDEEDLKLIYQLYNNDFCEVKLLDSNKSLHIKVVVISKTEKVSVEITDSHTHIKEIVVNDKIIFHEKEQKNKYLGSFTDRSCLNVTDIYNYAKKADLKEIIPLLDKQIKYNMAIAKEGMRGNYGVSIGKIISEKYDDTLINKIKSYTSAASEARMCGCPMPVMTNSGSGNQGITTSIPVIIFAREKGFSKSDLYKALVFANLITIHVKTGLGRLSAYCGVAVAASAAAGAMMFLSNGSIKQIDNTITNALADYSGIICDGAKSTCAIKIATCLDGAYLAYNIAKENKDYGCVGIIKNNVEDTIKCVGTLGHEGMKETDNTILDIMLKK